MTEQLTSLKKKRGVVRSQVTKTFSEFQKLLEEQEEVTKGQLRVFRDRSTNVFKTLEEWNEKIH